MSQLHVRHDGHSYDFQFTDLDIGDLSTDSQIRQAAASALGVTPTKLANFSIDRAANGEITLRPQAVFG